MNRTSDDEREHTAASEGSATSAAASVSKRQENTGPRPRILIVEDEVAVRRAFAKMLGRDFDVAVAEDGAAAVAILEAGDELDAVVTDVVMPRLGGVELYQVIRSRWPGLARRVLLVTGSVLTSSDLAMLMAGGVPVLKKPIGLEALSSAVRALIARASHHGDSGDGDG